LYWKATLIYTPKRYRNEFGQLLEHSPFCERDMIAPTFKEPKDEKGEFLIKVKKENQITDFIYATHPFDVVGWDGYFYPYKFNIKNFEPITEEFTNRHRFTRTLKDTTL
jgi:homogentisate 1,2-dioxygenase